MPNIAIVRNRKILATAAGALTLAAGALAAFAFAQRAETIETIEAAVPIAEPAPPDFHRGVCYAHSWRGGGYGSESSADSLAQLAAINVDSISLTPFIYQSTLESTDLRTIAGRDGAESDVAMAEEVQRAHEAGIRVMLKPHIWVRRGEWPGDISFERESDWAEWFAQYERAILHYAAFAESAGIDSLCIGNELKGSTVAQAARWRELVPKIRELYSGPLIYAANWDEYRHIEWWDLVDIIGVNAYFPLSDANEPDLAALCEGAERVRDEIEFVHKRFDRPVIFTEIGYRSMNGSAARPWEHGTRLPENLELQERCYEAVFMTFWDEPWLAGIYWWKWFSSAAARPGGIDHDPFSPRNKPAERTMVEWYGKARL